MEHLLTIFPATDFALLAVIVGLPLLGAIANGLFGKRAGNEAVTLIALSAVGVSFVASVVAFLMLHEAQHGEEAVRFAWRAWHWVNLTGRADSSFSVDVKFSIDALSGTMALVVTGIGFLIHLYSTKYMAEDPSYARFFTYMNLFIFAMLVLILGDSLPVLFVGWEGVGLCSYLLIGFWFQDEKNAAAGKKAFIANRIGDFGLLVAMGLLVYYVGALDWTGIENGRLNLDAPAKIWPIGSDVPIAQILPSSWAQALNTPRYISRATLVGWALFLGCAGKSAQIPLYVWLPDAMAGPTPVSALIHAATMVTAGVYLVCRMSSVFVLSPAAMFTVAIVGAVTAVFAATIAFAQNDIKKVLAYSTVSQLGYMFLGVGVGAFTAGFFHVFTHAFFKACLFLGAGSVIHAMHARIHGTDASQDMRNMGGLRRFMPYTFWTFAASWAAIVGLPGFSGFFSKDEILLKAYTSIPGGMAAKTVSGGGIDLQLWMWPTWGRTLLYGLGVLGAVMTAFYMSRLVIGIFFGEFRGWTISKKYKPADDDPHHHAEPGEKLLGPKPHESPWQMWLPLAILGAGALLVGYLDAPVLGSSFTSLERFLDPVFASSQSAITTVSGAEGLGHPLMAVAVVAFALGAGGAYWVYLQHGGAPAREFTERAPGLYRLVADKWRVDEFYEATVLGVVDALADMAVWFDRYVVDGILARLTSGLIALVGWILRYAQTGRVQAYAAVMVVGIGGVGAFLALPHALATVKSNDATGKYTVTAAPGLGYGYRWDADGDGKWDSEQFGDQRELAFELEPGKSRTVKLQVKNAFGGVASQSLAVERPKPDLSGATTIDVQQGPDGQLRGAVRGQDQPGQAQPGPAPQLPPGIQLPPGAQPPGSPPFPNPRMRPQQGVQP